VTAHREQHSIPELANYSLQSFEDFFIARRALLRERLKQALS
jgi:hypothetical protein